MQFAPGAEPASLCTICDEERQYIGHDGQQWTTQEQLREIGHANIWTEVEPGIAAIGLQPKVGIGQRAYLIQTGQLQVRSLGSLTRDKHTCQTISCCSMQSISVLGRQLPPVV